MFYFVSMLTFIANCECSLLKYSQCLEMLIERATLTDDAYHLRKTNWCWEPAGLLNDLVSVMI